MRGASDSKFDEYLHVSKVGSCELEREEAGYDGIVMKPKVVDAGYADGTYENVPEVPDWILDRAQRLQTLNRYFWERVDALSEEEESAAAKAETPKAKYPAKVRQGEKSAAQNALAWWSFAQCSLPLRPRFALPAMLL